jgi:Carboxypeptidase regulatory-like domain
MSHRWSQIALTALLTLGALPPPGLAQTPSSRGSLVVTVVDPSGAVIPEATVTVAGLDEATKTAALAPAKTTANAGAAFPRLVPGRYSIHAEFPGFEPGTLPDIRVNRGDNKQTITLRIQNLSESLTVARDAQAAGADRASKAFGLTVNQDQIQALSDDPAEMASQINDVAGSGAIIRIDGFEGQQLPPKAQIKSIHVTRDQFAAETEQPGSTFVDVITQPGIGPIRGTANLSFRDGSMSAKSPFTSTKGPEQNVGYGFNVGGALIKEKSNFSLAINGQNQYITPNLTVATPDGDRFDVLGQRQRFENVNINGLWDYALTRDQTFRFGYSQNNGRRTNQGIGAYDLPERAFLSDNNAYTFRALEAGPLGRRVFINSRLTMTWRDFGNTSSVEAPTIVVQDAFTSGGAQQSGRVHGKNMTAASDVDYIRGRHSWRAGVQLYADWYRADLNNNYLGTYFFSSLEAYQAGTPLLYRRSVGNPLLDFFHARLGAYMQDDFRPWKGLTFSPGIRYSYQTRVDDLSAFEPRLGVTWAPTKSGNTTLRASGGIFHGWLDPGIWWQTVRFDGQHQREVTITNPSYPDPGSGGVTPLANTYRLGNFLLNKNVRYSAGIDQKFSPKLSVNVLYNYYHQDQLPRGMNSNPITNGVRPDPNYANIISTVTDAEIIRHELYLNFNLNLAAGPPAAGGHTFNWRRVALNGGYSFIRARRNGIGPFDVPPSGSLATEWGHGPADNPYRVNVALTSTQIANVSIALSGSASDGNLYTELTGFDDNQDGLLNDRPPGVGIWTLRGTPFWSMNGRVTYNIPMGGANGRPTPAQRYKVSLFVSVNNVSNHYNLTGFSGVMTSPFFRRATAVQNPRKVDLGMNISF